MKKVFVYYSSFILVFLSISISFSNDLDSQEKVATFSLRQGLSLQLSDGHELLAWSAFVENEITAGRLIARSVQEEPDATVHERYDQVYARIPVWGAEVIRHLRDGKIYALNGTYYQDIAVDLDQRLTKEQAVEIGFNDLADSESFLKENAELVILPSQESDSLAYRFVLGKRGKAMMYFVDARSGQVLFKYDDLWSDAVIGSGTGLHNDTKKLSTDSYSGYFRTYDRLRPAPILTYDFLSNFSAWLNYTYSGNDLGRDGDNSWTESKQKPVVDGHAYTGWTYDYFYLVHDRKSYDNNNQLIRVMVNFDQWKYANAFYDPYDQSINFFNGDDITYTYFAGALDVVAHEYTHAVTDHTSQLIYYEFSGALNEAFSDIMGTCVEFYHQPEGTGFLKADWLCGEDTLKVYNENNCFRRLDKPYLLRVFGSFPYPDHWSVRYTGNLDYKGVHVNCTIISHWFYLISAGGTNRTSGITVSPIGLDKAEKITYRAWRFYLINKSNFSDARWATIQAATDLYGAGSQEVTVVKNGWQAVGIY